MRGRFNISILRRKRNNGYSNSKALLNKFIDMENKVASTVSFRAEINLQVSKVAKIITNCVDKLIPKEVFPSDEKIKIIK
ncbi:hypothetical protein HOK00_07680 [bacterium]|nr:hypothetical protein [bacterium]